MAPQDLGPELLAVIWVFTALSVITVALKLFTRAHVLHQLGLDDFFIFFSLALIIVCTSVFSYDVHLGMGRHAATLPPKQLSQAIKVNLIGNTFGIMVYSFPNISVAILIDRLLAPNQYRSRALYGLAISQCIIAGISCILVFTQCVPVDHLWNQDIPASCFKPGVVTGYSYFVGSYTALTDIILSAVPVMAFWKLELNMRTKIGLCVMMGCTWLAAICAIVKTTKIKELADTRDYTYDTVDLVIWANIEANVIIIAACLPTVRPLFRSGLFSWGTNNSLSKAKQNLQNSSGSSTEPSRGNSTDVEMQPKVSNTSSEHAIMRTTDINTSWGHPSIPSCESDAPGAKTWV